MSRYNTTTGILEPIFDKIKMLEKFLTKIEKDRFGKNPQAIILCDIIQDQLSLNYLQRVVIEEAFNQAIVNKRRQC